MYIVLVISILIVITVLILAVLTTSKAYTYKHTVDPIKENSQLNEQVSEKQKD